MTAVTARGGGDRVVVESVHAERAPVGGKPISRRAGRFINLLPIPKSRVSLMVDVVSADPDAGVARF